jgi:hypothetical protein
MLILEKQTNSLIQNNTVNINDGEQTSFLRSYKFARWSQTPLEVTSLFRFIASFSTMQAIWKYLLIPVKQE